MIKNFRDHAANERTYLAWIRTGFSVMAFGFLVEKFDIFLHYVARAVHKTAPMRTGGTVAHFLGIGLVLLGVMMMILATARYISVGRSIDESDMRERLSPALSVVMVAALIFMGLVLFGYLVVVGVHS